jgi:hypothetical protein
MKGEQGGHLQKVPIRKAFAVNYKVLELFNYSLKKSTKIELSYDSHTEEFRIEHGMNRLKGMIPGNTNMSQAWW